MEDLTLDDALIIFIAAWCFCIGLAIYIKVHQAATDIEICRGEIERMLHVLVPIPEARVFSKPPEDSE